MKAFEAVSKEIHQLIKQWEPIFLSFSENVYTNIRNAQNRSIKQLVGHMNDSASNNTHRAIHLQLGETPFYFPDYANLGKNEEWIKVQNYQEENWQNLVQLWKYSNLHFAHIIGYIKEENFKKEWISALDERIPLELMVNDYLRHFKLHLNEISEMIE